MGRRTILTPAIIEETASALASGAHYDQVAAHLEVSERTFYSWLAKGRAISERLERQGEDHEEPSTDDLDLTANDMAYLQFAQAVEKARGSFMVRAHAHWAAAFPNNWQAVVTWFERTDPRRYARRNGSQIDEAEAAEARRQAGNMTDGVRDLDRQIEALLVGG